MPGADGLLERCRLVGAVVVEDVDVVRAEITQTVFEGGQQ